MRDGRDERFCNALFSLIAAHLGFGAAALVDNRQVVSRLVAATPEFLALWRAGPLSSPVPDRAARIDPELVGIEACFAAAAPIRSADGTVRGCLVVADRRARRMTPAIERALGDAADLALPMLPRPAPRIATVRPPGEPVRSRPAVERLIAASLRRRATKGVGLMLIDLDRFRAVNDALGSAAGDAILAATGARIRAALRRGGLALRLEGDRFVVVAPGDRAALEATARRLLAAIHQPVMVDGETLTVQASIGMVAGPAADAVPAVLLIQAATALRRARLERRDRFALHEAAHAAATFDGSRLELDLAGALANGQMHLVYQPFVDLADGRVAGFETLLRWRHPLRGELNPASFIAAAETTGQILPLGDWVLRTALAAAARWPERFVLAVNISPLQFHQPGFLAGVDAALAESGLAPERLELEITETVLMRDNAETTALLQALITRGIRIALDDFGTGYSALAYLGRLPHHRIKLDKAFVQDLANHATRDLIRAIITVARAQSVAVTAEGVERPEQVTLVRRMGFTHAQGYATGLPVAEPERWFTPTAAAAAACGA